MFWFKCLSAVTYMSYVFVSFVCKVYYSSFTSKFLFELGWRQTKFSHQRTSHTQSKVKIKLPDCYIQRSF